MCIFQTRDNHKPYLEERKSFFKSIIKDNSENSFEIIRMTLESLNDDNLKAEWD